MNMENVIHEERQKTYLVLVIVFIIVAALLLSLVLFPGLFYKSQLPDFTRMVLLIVAVVDLILFLSFSQLTIKVTSEYLQIGFGIFKKKILFTAINDFMIEDYEKLRYLGYGIRIGRDKSIGYVARGGRGIRVIMKPRDCFFTTDSPEQLLAILKQQLSPTRKIND